MNCDTTADRDRVIRTALFLLILLERFSAQEDLWRRAAQKAGRWIADSAASDLASVQKWLKEVKIPK